MVDYEVVPSGPFNSMAIVLVGDEKGWPVTNSKAPVRTVCMCVFIKSIYTENAL